MKTIMVLILLFAQIIPNEDQLFITFLNKKVVLKNFPVVFHFHNDFPEEKKTLFVKEINALNEIIGFEVFKVSNQIETTKNRYLTTKNVIYWRNKQEMLFGQQAKTDIVYFGDSIVKIDIAYNNSFPYVDFGTITRHELLHALGIQHKATNLLMHPYLPNFTKRDWDLELISSWKKEVFINKIPEIKYTSF